MTEKHFSPAIGEYALRELSARRERDGLVEELVEAARHYQGFVDLEIPSVYVCPTCAPAFPDELDAAKLRLLSALEALADHDDGGAGRDEVPSRGKAASDAC